jgi:hypothetical protein
MDTLPAQGSAVSSERVFSSAKRTITDERNRLISRTIEVKQIMKFSFKSSRLSLQSRWNTTLIEAAAATVAEELEAALKSRDANSLEQLVKELKES